MPSELPALPPRAPERLLPAAGGGDVPGREGSEDEDEIDTGLAEWEADFRRGAGPPSDESEDGADDDDD